VSLVVFCKQGQDRPMARPGRPSKGDRTVLWSRVPTEVADAIKAEATRRGLPYGDVVAEILSGHYGVDYAPTRSSRIQEALELTA
jgi:hypothetical protein